MSIAPPLYNKRFCTIIICLFSTISMAFATENLKLFLNNSETIVLPLSEHPAFEFNGDEVIVSSQSYKIYDIRKYLFYNDDSGRIDDTIVATDSDITIVNGSIIVNHFDNAKISICDISGKVYTPRLTITGSSAVIDLLSLVPNTYIISVGSKSIKILRK